MKYPPPRPFVILATIAISCCTGSLIGVLLRLNKLYDEEAKFNQPRTNISVRENPQNGSTARNEEDTANVSPY